MKFTLLLQPSSSFFKGKFIAEMDEKSHGKRKAAKETNKPEKTGAATAHGGLYPGQLLYVLNLSFFALPWTTGFALDQPS